jgi:hypothetical protein
MVRSPAREEFMKVQSVLFSVILGLSVAVVGSTHAGASARASSPVAFTDNLTADPLEIPATPQAQINAAIAACRCVDSITPWQVIPIGTAAQVFTSPGVLFAVLDLDVQLPWAAAGQINSGALNVLLGGQAGLINQISAVADPSGGGFKLGAYRWSHPTAPDFCSGETLYFMYFERTGALFAFRFDSSRDC